MSPPLSQADLEAIGRIVDRKIEEKIAPVKRRVDNHSGQYRELGPALTRQVNDSQHEIEERSMGFERMMMTAVGRLEQKVDEAAQSIPPAATAAQGAELAAVAGAQASVRTEGTTKAVQVAANRADTQSLAAKVSANRAVILVIVQTVALGIWQAYQAITGAH